MNKNLLKSQKEYCKEIARSTKRGLSAKAQSGWFPGRAPFGYKNSKDNKISSRKSEVHKVKKIYNLFIDGKDLNYICNEVELSKYQIRKILGNIFYTGKFKYSGSLYIGKHEAIIEQGLFEKVNNKLNKTRKC